MARTQTATEVDGRRIQLTSLDKVLYPATGTTKAEVISYYAQVADALVPHCAGRPVTRKRWVDGVGTPAAPSEMFFAKQLDSGTPEWVVRADLQHTERRATYPLVHDRASLVWLAQMGALELHVPQWQFDSAGQVQVPDRIVFDLDPGPGVPLTQVAEVACWVRDILAGMGWSCVPVTSGSKGVHVYAVLDGGATAEQVGSLAHELAKTLEADHPDLVISRMKRADRAGKVFIDWSQNNPRKTTITPYSLRGTFAPQVAAPRTWDELADPQLRQLTPAEVLDRLASQGDLMAAAGFDALAPYRGKRRADSTPEPAGERAAGAAEVQPGDPGTGPAGDRVFVIHEHHARRLHWDLRLGYRGVLTSFAMPKGAPTDPARQHLAVQTEDHPLDYLTFSGTIPKGQYGAGEMSVWDTGTFDVRKWWLGKEIIVDLHGRPEGPLAQTGSSFALICTDPEQRQWLVHAMQPRTPVRAPADPPEATSAVSHSRDHSSPQPDLPKPTPAVSHRSQADPPKPAPAVSHRSQADVPKVSSAVPRPMLATPGTPAEVGTDWAIELKWDGQRVLAQVEGDRVRLWARSGREITASYPELAEIEVHAPSAVLDGEVVALDADARPSFALLQPRMQATPHEAVRLARRQPVQYVLFDVLAADGHDLTRAPYRERRQLLERLVEPSDRVQVPAIFDGDLDAAMAASRAHRLEGVVAKRPDSRYLPDRRSKSWIKIKHTEAVDVVVCGWRPGRGERAGRVGSLLVAVPTTAGELRYVGRVGTGFSANEARQWLAWFTPAEIDSAAVHDVPAADARDAHWLPPERVAEVEFGEWTPGGRLRHPRWRGWRPDLSAAEIRPPTERAAGPGAEQGPDAESGPHAQTPVAPPE